MISSSFDIDGELLLRLRGRFRVSTKADGAVLVEPIEAAKSSIEKPATKRGKGVRAANGKFTARQPAEEAGTANPTPL